MNGIHMTTPLIKEPGPNQLLLEALEKRWKNYRAEIKHGRTEFSNEVVHDLRVATRRMLAFIQLWNLILPHPRLKKMTRAFKDQLNDFDDLRDTQVILTKLSEIIDELPQLKDFQKHLQSTEERLLRTLHKKIKQLEIDEISKRVRKTHAAIEAESNNDLRSQIMHAVDEAYLNIKQRQEWVDLTRSVTIHRVRVAFKTFRYMIEIVQPFLKDFPDENLKRMNDYQDLMGEVQDSEVFAQTLEDFSEDAPIADPEPVRHYSERRHAAAISAYAEAVNQINNFWRSTPEESFPWEKTK